LENELLFLAFYCHMLIQCLSNIFEDYKVNNKTLAHDKVIAVLGRNKFYFN